jgi:hypothetical protein
MPSLSSTATLIPSIVVGSWPSNSSLCTSSISRNSFLGDDLVALPARRIVAAQRREGVGTAP